MTKTLFKMIFYILLIFLAQPFVSANEVDINYIINGKYSKTFKDGAVGLGIETYHKQDEVYLSIKKEYKSLLNDFIKEFEKKNKYLNQSLSIEQEFMNSKELLLVCKKYLSLFETFKEKISLVLLPGDWKGNGNIKIFYKTDKEEIKVYRDFDMTFELNQAGLVSKGIIQGDEKLIKRIVNRKEKNEKNIASINTRRITGNITGNIVPGVDSSLEIKLESKDTSDRIIEKFNKLKFTSKTITRISPLIKENELTNVYSLFASKTKIYYNLFFDSSNKPIETLKKRFNLFFDDILLLIDFTYAADIPKSVYKAIGIYKQSSYVDNAFSSYVKSLITYFNNSINEEINPAMKIKRYEEYLSNLIQLAAFTRLGIVSEKLNKDLNLDLNNENNLINIVFKDYYLFSDYFYASKIKALDENQETFIHKNYKIFKIETDKILESGVISKKTIESLKP